MVAAADEDGDEEDAGEAAARARAAAGAAAAARAEAAPTRSQMATQNSPTAATSRPRWPRKIGTPSATC